MFSSSTFTTETQYGVPPILVPPRMRDFLPLGLPLALDAPKYRLLSACAYSIMLRRVTFTSFGNTNDDATTPLSVTTIMTQFVGRTSGIHHLKIAPVLVAQLHKRSLKDGLKRQVNHITKI